MHSIWKGFVQNRYNHLHFPSFDTATATEDAEFEAKRQLRNKCSKYGSELKDVMSVKELSEDVQLAPTRRWIKKCTKALQKLFKKKTTTSRKRGPVAQPG